MECAFNIDLLHKFPKESLCGYHVFNDIKKYKVSNLNYSDSDTESAEIFCSELCDDYNEHRANYKSFIWDGINARVMWELRKSAILWEFMEGDIDPWFFEAHKKNWDAYDIKHYRSSILSQKFVDYEDHDWQYFWVLRFAKGIPKYVADDYFDMEKVYIDCDPYKADDLGGSTK